VLPRIRRAIGGCYICLKPTTCAASSLVTPTPAGTASDFDPISRNQVLVLQSNPACQFRPVDPRLDGKDFALLERVVPFGVEVRVFVGLETDAVAEVVGEARPSFSRRWASASA